MTTPLAKAAEKAVEELEKNPYYDKYAAKIAQLQKTSPEEFLARVEQKKKQSAKPAEPKEKERQFTSLLKPKKNIQTGVGAQQVPLDKYMKVETVKDMTADEIKEIWLKYHIQKEVIAATIPAAEYDKMVEQANKIPLFLLPLPRSQGYEFIVLQHHFNTVHFTPLICYQVHKENAPECLTVTNYTEFKDDKGIVLMRGEFDKNTIDAKEAQCLANQLQLYYNQRDPEKLKLMETFTFTPEAFKHQDLIKQIETLSL